MIDALKIGVLIFFAAVLQSSVFSSASVLGGRSSRSPGMMMLACSRAITPMSAPTKRLRRRIGCAMLSVRPAAGFNQPVERLVTSADPANLKGPDGRDPIEVTIDVTYEVPDTRKKVRRPPD